MSSPVRGRYSVYIVELPVGYRPQSVHCVPDVLLGAEVYARKLPAYAALGFVVAYNKRQAAERWPDRKWAIAVAGRLTGSTSYDQWALEDQAAASAVAADTPKVAAGRIVSSEVFQRVYEACSAADLPKVGGTAPAAWWRSMLTLARATGLRRRTLLSLRRADLDTRRWRLRVSPEADKPGSGHEVFLNRETARHLLAVEGDLLFPWPHGDRVFYAVFENIQTAAGITAEDRLDFDDLRRTFVHEHAADKMSATLASDATELEGGAL